MATSKEKNSNSALSNFPFVKLIWPVFILLVLLIFKTPIETLLLGSDDVAVEILGVKIKIAQSDVDELSVIQKEFEEEISGLNDTIMKQNTALEELAKMNEELEEKAKNCPAVKEATKQFSKGVDEFIKSNSALKSRASEIREKKIFKIPSADEEKVKEEVEKEGGE